MLLSIIIPVYNLENYIVGTLDTLLPAREDVEIVIVNDGSTDCSDQVMSDYISRTASNIRYFKQKNCGVSSARNLGAAKATGEYVLFLDGDDVLADGSLTKIYESLSVSKPDILFWPYHTVSEQWLVLNQHSFKVDSQYTNKGSAALLDLLKTRSFYLVIGNAAYKKEVLVHNGLEFTPGCVAGEDMEFTWKALSLAKCVQFLPSALLKYIQREGSTIHRYSISRFDSCAALLRTGKYLHEQGQSESAKLVSGIELLVNYMGTYRLCLEQKMKEEKMGALTASKQVINDIQQHYPGLDEQAYRLLKQHRKFFPINKAALFSLSPIMYMRFAQFRQSVHRRLLKPVKRCNLR